MNDHDYMLRKLAREELTEGVAKRMVAAGCFIIIVKFALIAAITAVAWHFIAKWW